MLSNDKIKAVKETQTPAVADPGVKKQLAALIATAVLPEEGPKQAVAMKEGKPENPTSKKALKWANKKFGEAQVVKLAKANGQKPRRWALAKYNEWLDDHSDDNAQISNRDALRGKKIAKAKAIKAAVSKPKSVWYQLGVDTAEAVKNALDNFVDNYVKEVANAFVTLYTSRKTEGDSDEAVLALDACRKAFDACGLILADVETQIKKPAKVNLDNSSVPDNKRPAPAFPKSKAAAAIAVVEKKVRKELTKEQRDAKNKADRDRRANKKGAKS